MQEGGRKGLPSNEKETEMTERGERELLQPEKEEEGKWGRWKQPQVQLCVQDKYILKRTTITHY